MSDGQPYMDTRGHGCYSGYSAEEHTRKMVNLIRRNGVKVISYFISSDDESDYSAFKRMYGVDARFVNITDIVAIAKTLNQKFLSEK